MKKILVLACSLVVAFAFVFASGNNEKAKTKTASTKKDAHGCCAAMAAKECSDKMASCDDKGAKMSKKSDATKSGAKAEVRAEAKTETATDGTK
jgi:hypothetical protein